MKKLLMIVNPNAGKSQIKGKLTDILDVFIKAGYRIEIHITQKPKEAVGIVRRRGRYVDRVVCSGGDGTLDETINGLMLIPEEKRPELGYISAGTTNDFAHSLKLPAQMLEAADIAANGIPFRVDVGKMNDDYFCYVAGFGAFTGISYTTPQDVKKVLGHQAYIMEGAKQIMNMKPIHVRVEADEHVYEDDFLCALVSNSYRVGGITGLWGKEIEMDEGLFEVTLIRQPLGIAEWGGLVADLLANGEDNGYVIRFKAARIHFVCESPVDWVKDGEFGGTLSDVEIVNLHRAITIIKNP